MSELPPWHESRLSSGDGDRRGLAQGRAVLRLPLAFLLLATPAAFADDAASAAPVETPRGPAEIRDGQLLAQPRLTLPAVSPATVAPGRFELRVAALWSNSFSWTQDVPGESPKKRSFLLDGETAIVDVSVRRGVGADADVGVRLVAHGRGGGALDGFIDFWHSLVKLPNGNRPAFRRDAFRVVGRTTSGAAFSWNDAAGWGLGNLEIDGRYRLADGAAKSPSAALVGRVSLPTGSGPYADAGFGAAAQLAVDVPLGRRFDLFTGMGVSAQDPGPVRGIEYETARLHGYAALEWRVARPLSLLVETNAATRLVANIESYPGTHWLVNFGGRLDLGRRARLDLFLTENIVSQQTTTDFAIYAGLTLRP